MTTEYWLNSQVAQHFADRPPSGSVLQFLKQVMPELKPPRRVLDLGCGGGRHLLQLAQWTDLLHGCDRSSEMLECAARQMAHFKHHVHLNECDMEQLPYQDGSFDVVVMSGVLHNATDLNHLQRALQELWRITAAGGWVYLNTFTAETSSEDLVQLGGHQVYSRYSSMLMVLLPEDTLLQKVQELGFQPPEVLDRYTYQHEGISRCCLALKLHKP